METMDYLNIHIPYLLGQFVSKTTIPTFHIISLDDYMDDIFRNSANKNINIQIST